MLQIMNKDLYSKPEVEIIEIELQTTIMMGSKNEPIDPSNTTDGEFHSKRRGFSWDEI